MREFSEKEILSIDVNKNEDLSAYLLSRGYRIIRCNINWIPFAEFTFEGFNLSAEMARYHELSSHEEINHLDFYLKQIETISEAHYTLANKELDEFEKWKGSHYLWHQE